LVRSHRHHREPLFSLACILKIQEWTIQKGDEEMKTQRLLRTTLLAATIAMPAAACSHTEAIKPTVARVQITPASERPFVLGAKYTTTSRAQARDLGLGRLRGASVQQVRARGAAPSLQLHDGDVILRANARPINSARRLSKLIKTLNGASELTVTVWRNGGECMLSTDPDRRMTARAESQLCTASILQFTRKVAKRKPISPKKPFILGAQAHTLSRSQAKLFGIGRAKGVVIKSVSRSGAAARLKLRKNDVLLKLNGVRVRSVASLEKLAKKLDSSSELRAVIWRGKSTRTLVAQNTRPGRAKSVARRPVVKAELVSLALMQ